MDKLFSNGDNGIMPAVKGLIRSAEHSVLALGAAFGNSMESCGGLVRARMREGIRFKIICLASTADLRRVAPRSGLTVEVLGQCVQASLEALENMRAEDPDHFSYDTREECPPYRIYIADPKSAAPRGIVVFGGVGVRGGVYVSNFFDSAYESLYADALRWIEGPPAPIVGRSGNHTGADSTAPAPASRRKVFVIHGHNEAKRRELEALLREFGVLPVVLADRGPRGSKTVPEMLEEHAKECSLAIALFTPDDLVVKDGQQYLQPRPNAMLEVGYFWSRLGRERVVLIAQRGLAPVEIYNSNLSGILRHEFNTNVTELYKPLREELEAAGLIP